MGVHRHAGVSVVVAALAMLIGACSSAPSPTHSPSPAPTGLAHFAGSGIAFDYPAAWSAAHWDNVSSFTSLIAYVGTTEFHDPCTRTANSVSCGPAYALGPGQLAVAVGNAAFPGFDILKLPEGAVPVTAGGLPGYVSDAQPVGDTGAAASRSWVLAMPGSIDNYYTVNAEIRDLDPATAFAPVDALVASLTYDQPVVPLPTGAATEAAAEAAVRSALAVMVRGDPSYACFPASGSRTFLVGALPGMGPLGAPQPATCSTSIQATPLQLWKAHLVLHLSKADVQDGSGVSIRGVDITMYITADGQPGATTSTSLDK